MLDFFSSCDHLHLTDDLLHSIPCLISMLLYHEEKLLNSFKLIIFARVLCSAKTWIKSNLLSIYNLHNRTKCFSVFRHRNFHKLYVIKNKTYQLILISRDSSKYGFRKYVCSIFFSLDVCYGCIWTIRADD